MSSIVEINDPEELEEIRQLWQSLLKQTEGASFFQTLDWLQLYWGYYGQDQRLRVLVVHDDRTPVGILPLVIVPERHKVVTLRMLSYPQHDWGGYFGPIGAEPEKILLAGMEHIRNTRRDWDCIDLRWINLQDRDRGRTAEVVERAGFKPQLTRMAENSVLDLQGDWQAFLSSRPKDWQRKIRHRERKLAERGEITYVRHRPRGAECDDVDPRFDLYDACEQIVDKSWQASAKFAGPMSKPEFRGYLRRLHEAASRCGMVDANLLLVGKTPVACSHGYYSNGYIFSTRTTYDPEYSKFGVGKLLKCRMIEDCFKRGDRAFDFGPGFVDIKADFRSRLVGMFRCTHFPANWRAQVLRMARFAKTLFHRNGKIRQETSATKEAIAGSGE